MIELPRLASVLLVALSSLSANAMGDVSPRWFDQGRLTPQAQQLLSILAAAPDYGLPAQDYRLDVTPTERQSLTAGAAAPPLLGRFDAALSQAARRFVMDLRYGRVDPRTVNFELPAPSSPADAERMLDALAHSTDVAAAVSRWEPKPPPYHALKQALGKYRQLALDPKLSALPRFDARSLQVGAEYSGAPQLRALLVALDDLPADDAAVHSNQTSIDVLLAVALTRFQARHGLTVDGVLGKGTFAALTVPLQQRVRQLELTLERWRWIAARERPDIVVNVPQFRLYALPRGDHRRGSILEMPVIVGRSYPHMRTPVFTANLRQVVFHPFWDVPANILRRELLPLIVKDRSYLTRHHMEIVRGASDNAQALQATPRVLEGLAAGRYRLRQRPGPDNALGAIKFVMPNPYSVYLHSTPQTELFQRARRAFSHGCIRISEPAALAEYVLRSAPGNWSAAAIEAALTANQTARITLAEPLRVTVFYSTAAATESGGVAFYDDLYGHDRTLQAALDSLRP
jgi:murein L,D-transpeptidase YcbB/YkuD